MPEAAARRLHDEVDPDDPFAIARLITDHATDAIFLLDHEGRTTFASPAAEAMFGWRAAELVGRKLHDVVHYRRPDGTPFPMSECPLGNVFTTGQSLRLHEDLFFRRDGSELPVACSNAAIMRDDTVTGSVLIVRDVSERRKAERQRHLLLEELNHRVKNMLAVVQSMVSQTLKEPHYADARKVLSGRLQAMAVSQDILTRGEGTAAPLRQLVERAVAPFAAADSVLLSGPDLSVPPRVATALAMTLHELATNAAKYGALSAAQGKVAIKWQANGEEAAANATLVWRESGGPPVAAPSGKGFGSRMIAMLLAAEPGGAATVEYLPEGLRCTLVVPVEG